MALQQTDPNAIDSGRYTPETITRQRRIVDAMMLNATKQRPIQHWMQGVAQLGESLMAGLRSRQLDEAERQNERDSAGVIRDSYNSAMPGMAAKVDPTSAPATMPNAATSLLEPSAPTSVTADRGAFLSSIAPAVAEAAKATGIDPRIIQAQAILESNWGKSAPGNNLFGIKGPGTVRPTTEIVNGQPVRMSASFQSYASPADSVGGYASFMQSNPRYKPLMAAQGLEAQADALQKSGYATDPRYGAKVLQIARTLSGGAAASADATLPQNAQPTQGALSAPSQSPYDVAGPLTASARVPIAPALTGLEGASPSMVPPQMPEGKPAATNRDVAAAMSRAPAAPAAPVGQLYTGTAQQPDVSKLIAAVSNPYISESARTAAMNVLNTQLAANKLQHLDLGNAIAITDQRGNIIRTIPKGEPNKGPQFVETGEIDAQTGQPIKGWVDPRDRSVVPYRPQNSATTQPSSIPPVPPGVDPKVWRETQSKRVTEEAMPASDTATSKLRNEIQGLPSYKNIAQAAPVYKSMLEAASRDNRAADVNLIYGMAKIMDPGSVVREGEMSIAQAIATLPQRLQATIQSQLTGDGRLSPEVRASIMQEARGRIGAYQSMFDQDAAMYRGIAQRNRMNEADVLPTFGPFEDYKPPSAAVSPDAIDNLVKKYSK
ncbi:glycoside hydrolase family 73 protein [Bradyrhizobium sp. WSM1743]|uniref:glycoside hydrolase family 73 protein n=1 Tax=Bradyrhizobium sp. WSM1743 TaxID=318996 RepID=UPI000685AE85|nr:glucosaminidase domain-containing protein [Bradyrhizobium sp. WSM1743]